MDTTPTRTDLALSPLTLAELRKRRQRALHRIAYRVELILEETGGRFVPTPLDIASIEEYGAVALSFEAAIDARRVAS